jgi:glycosyltransferase involved in cell wall biosynthesis
VNAPDATAINMTHNMNGIVHVLQALRLGGIETRVVDLAVLQGISLARCTLGDRPAARSRLGISKHRRVVDTVGRLLPEKAYDMLIRAVCYLPDDVALVIVGDGPLRNSLEALVAELGLGGRVHLVGHHDDIELLLPGLDVFCMSSQHEGLPRSVLEAQACGVTVVATDVGDLCDAVDPKSGVIVPVVDAAALASAIMDVFTRPSSATDVRAVVETRYSLASARFSIERMIGTSGEAHR